MLTADRVSLRHAMHYRYDRPVRLGPQVVRLSPAANLRSRIESYALAIRPENHALSWLQDPGGNWLARAVFPERTDELQIDVHLQLELRAMNPFDFLVDADAADWPFEYAADTRRELAAYLAAEPGGPLLAEFVAEWQGATGATVEQLVALNARLHAMLRYEVRAEPGVFAPDETLARGSGSCRDIAWLAVQVLRTLGVGARFVSGYLLNLAAVASNRGDGVEVEVDEDDGDGEYSGLHAWVEVYLPGAGWVGMDPTSGVFCNEAYIPLAACVHYAAAAPLTGSHEPARVEFHHELRVERLAPGSNPG